MRFTLFILAFIGCIISSSVLYATPDGCKYDTESTSTFSQMLQDCASGTNGIEINGAQDKDGVKALVVKVAKTVLSFGALFAVGAIVLSGIQYNTAYGDDEKIKKAKNTGIYAIIGLLLLLLAFPLVDIIVKFIYSIGNT